MKFCTRCCKEKLPTAFYASQPHSSTCIECTRANQRARNRHRDVRQQEQREFAIDAIAGRFAT